MFNSRTPTCDSIHCRLMSLQAIQCQAHACMCNECMQATVQQQHTHEATCVPQLLLHHCPVVAQQHVHNQTTTNRHASKPTFSCPDCLSAGCFHAGCVRLSTTGSPHILQHIHRASPRPQDISWPMVQSQGCHQLVSSCPCAPQHKQVALVCVKHTELGVTVAHLPVALHLTLLEHLHGSQHSRRAKIDCLCLLPATDEFLLRP